MLIILPLMLGITIYRWNAKFNAALISKVSDDLTVAHQYFERIVDSTGQSLAATTESGKFQEALRQGNGSSVILESFLRRTAEKNGFDFLYVVGDDGRIIDSEYPLASKDVRWNWPIVNAALRGSSRTSVDVFRATELAAISAQLARRARIRIIPTESSAASSLTEETSGLVLQSASALMLPDGQHAALVGGMLLNQNLAFVDTINDLIYHGSGLPQGSRGTVTLFLSDVRISTNVRMFQGNRAIGTRVSMQVRDAVLEHGQTWLDRAFVVNDWYVSGYEPLLDSYGRRVGMLYAGFLQKPFVQAKRQTLLEIASAFLIAVAATVPLFLRWAREIFRPLENMTDTIARAEAGNFAARTGPVKGKGEIARVSLHLDHLLDRIQSHDARQRQWNEDLSQRVDERTQKLQLATQQLEATTKQLVMSEKLAAIGEITAGIAHEINNPVAVMQGNLEVIRDLMGSRAEAAATEFKLIDEQLRRISDIVTRLLQFAKPQEYAAYSEQYDAAQIVTDTLPLVQHLLNKTTIVVEKDYRAARLIMMNRTELQQVVVNLMVNAIHAMPDGGRLTLRTFDRDEGLRPGVVIEIADTGIGMVSEIRQRVFDPFFTTKRIGGTGLGLSISQMLVSRQGGTISVDSEPGKGATFAIWLPEAH